MDVFLIHGTYSTPYDNWFPWLKNELEGIGCKVHVPKFPTPENQSLSSWMEVMKDKMKYLDEKSILIGHSLGCAFILSILERIDVKIEACILVAGFASSLGNPKFDSLNKTFVEKDFNWEKIKSNCKDFFIFYSDNDPYVPKSRGEKLAEKLGAESFMVKGGGHFNKDSDFETFPMLLNRISEEYHAGRRFYYQKDNIKHGF